MYQDLSLNNMKKLYFDIKNICCSYKKANDKQAKIALEVESLEIPKGEIIFIVGQSGCGKSTILESLGLMNNTLEKKHDSRYTFHPSENESIDYTTIWEKGNSYLSRLRLDHFSFIFQQTNLMKSFNVYENIAMTLMLQGANQSQALAATVQVLKEVGLKDDFIKINDCGSIDINSQIFNLPTEASGGQRQRMAFARAIIAKFNILFCDEPTGNLDPFTADMLMAFLQNEMKKKTESTAIIVSHDLPMAMKYGDRIIKIFKKHGIANKVDDFHGTINSSSVFEKTKEGWLHNHSIINDGVVLEILREQ